MSSWSVFLFIYVGVLRKHDGIESPACTNTIFHRQQQVGGGKLYNLSAQDIYTRKHVAVVISFLNNSTGDNCISQHSSIFFTDQITHNVQKNLL